MENSTYLREWEDMEYTEARNIASYFMKYPEVAKAFYETLTRNRFPENELSEFTYTPSWLFYEYDLDLWEAYMYIIKLREDPATTMFNIAHGIRS